MAWEKYAPDNLEYSYINWDGYGIKLSIPPGAMEKGVKYTIAMKAVDVPDLVLPDFEVVSAIYWVFSSHPFLKPVNLEIKHCAELSEKFDILRMGIITAKCNEGSPAQNFRKVFNKSDRIKFELQSRQAFISTRYFSYFAAFREWFFPNKTFYVYMVFGKKTKMQNIWHYDLFFLKDIEPLIKVYQGHVR